MIHKFYGHKAPYGFTHIFPSITQVKMCGKDEVIPLSVSECETGEYHGWIYSDETRPTMIFKNPKSLEICFTYGIQAEIDAGHGRRVRLKVEEFKS